MDTIDLKEHRDRLYKATVQSTSFLSHLRTYNTYLSDKNLHQQLQVVQENGIYVLFGMLKIYWGTKKVIRLKKEELSWKRKSTRIVYDNGLDEKLMSAMGSGAKNRRSLTKQHDVEDPGNQGEESGKTKDAEASRQTHRCSDAHVDYLNGKGVKRGHEEPYRQDVEAGANAEEEEEEQMAEGKLGQSLTMPRNCSLQRRTMSFSGHLYNSKTAVFRPKYGTISNVRVSSRQTTCEVIGLLLKKFAVENKPEEFNLYWVLHNGETHAFQPNEFPLVKRVQLGPDENVAKIFIQEKKSDEISPEVAGYINLRFSELDAILRKFNEEEDKEVMKIRQRYVQYKANLQKKLAVLAAEIEKESKSKTKHKDKEKKKNKGKGKGKGKKK